MKQKVRTFVAVAISPSIRQAASELVDVLSAAGADVKWVAAHNMHFTLKFLGDVDSRQIHTVCRSIQQSVADHNPFQLQVRGAGAFPNTRRPRTLRLGTGQGTELVEALAECAETALEKLGFRRESRRFFPHLTIGRVRRTGPGLSELGGLLEKNQETDLGRATVSELIIFSSQLDRSGPSYDALGRAKLGAR